MKYYYITGTSRGIGKALAENILSHADSFVYGISRKESIKSTNYKHFHIDLSEIDQILNFEFQKHNIEDEVFLINNAGTLGEIKHFGNLENKEIVKAYNLNIIAPAILSNKFIASYKNTSGKKTIMNISSGAGKTPYDGWGVYCSSKAALDMMTRVIDEEQKLDNMNLKIVAVAPGIVDTNMQNAIRNIAEKDFSQIKNFLDYKNNELLVSPEAVSEKLLRILHNSELNYVITSVRDI